MHVLHCSTKCNACIYFMLVYLFMLFEHITFSCSLDDQSIPIIGKQLGMLIQVLFVYFVFSKTASLP